MIRRPVLVAAAMAALSVVCSAQAAELVLPPGQEALLGTMLGLGKQPVAGCLLEKASVQKSVVVAEYHCGPKKQPAVVSLFHAAAKPDAPVRTTAFAIVPDPKKPAPPELLAELERRLRAGEAGVKWIVPVVGGRAAQGGGPGLVGRPASSLKDLTKEESAEYEKGLVLYRAQKYDEALGIYLKLARGKPKVGVLGMLVATLAPRMHETALARRLARTADHALEDSLAQFVAGVASHYAAHQAASSLAERKALYQEAVKYLTRVLPVYSKEPRVYIYLAVSHYRLGQQAKAEEYIEKGVALAADDPDSYYCRAEIFHKKNRRRAIEDLKTYVASVARLVSEGAVVSEKKTARVTKIIAHLTAVEAGTEKPIDYFAEAENPLRPATAPTGGGEPTSNKERDAQKEQEELGGGADAPPRAASRGFGMLVAAVAGAAFLLTILTAWWARRRSRRAGSADRGSGSGGGAA